MRPNTQIEKLLSSRLQFLEQLFLISSYQELISTNTGNLKQKHSRLEKLQQQVVAGLLQSFRIDDVFKKQFHACVIRVFTKIQSKVSLRKYPTGSYKDILYDYVVFFTQLKEKNILDFIRQNFQSQVYNQTTIIFVLLELLFKFLRIKCMSFITERIQPKSKAMNKIQLFFTNSDRNSNRQRSKLSKRPRTGSPFASKRDSSSFYEKQSENFQLNCKNIRSYSSESNQNAKIQQKKFSNSNRILRSAKERNSPIHSPYTQLHRPKRRVIKSFKDIQQQTKQKIEKSIQIIANAVKQRNQCGPQTYYRIFHRIFKSEWSTYLYLTNLNEYKENEPRQIKNETEMLHKKKLQWYSKNCQKIIVQACIRNDQIRKQMQNYAEMYRAKFHKLRSYSQNPC